MKNAESDRATTLKAEISNLEHLLEIEREFPEIYLRDLFLVTLEIVKQIGDSDTKGQFVEDIATIANRYRDIE